MIMRSAILLLTMLATLGCHMFEDPENLDPCPLGDGYPCSCDIDDGAFCDDNNRCYSMNGDYQGFCTQRCVGPTDCSETRGFGLEGICGLSIDQAEGPDYCILVCDDGLSKTDCPPGQICEWQDRLGYSVCLPRAFE